MSFDDERIPEREGPDFALLPAETWMDRGEHREVRWTRIRGMHRVSLIELERQVAAGRGATFEVALADAINDLMRRAHAEEEDLDRCDAAEAQREVA